MKKGFTLIELLVVVLIIGILSAIALPQYTTAVEKSRMSEAFVTMGSLQKAIDVYLTSNGMPSSSGWVSFTGEESIGDIELSCLIQDDFYCETKNFTYYAHCFSSGCEIAAFRATIENIMDMTSLYKLSFIKETAAGTWNKICWTENENIGTKICKSLKSQGWTSETPEDLI